MFCTCCCALSIMVAAQDPSGAADRSKEASRTKGNQVPAALIAVEKSRQRLSKGEVQWTHRTWNGVSRHYTFRFANGDRLQIDRGNDEGASGYESDGTPVVRIVSELITRNGEKWSSDSPFKATRGRTYETLYDGLALDLAPNWSGPFDSVHDALWGSMPMDNVPIFYESSRDGELHVVAARKHLNQQVYEQWWWIDPLKDWCPLKLQTRRNGVLTSETRITLSHSDGVWFPRKIERFRRSHKDLKEVWLTVTIHSARFNESEMPDRLGPMDIGVDVGTTVVLPGDSMPHRWDGRHAIPYHEFAALEREGKLRPGPRWLAAWEEYDRKNPQQSADPALNMICLKVFNPWQEYVTKFIHKNDLTEEQRLSALGVLRDCERQAKDHIERHPMKLAKLNLLNLRLLNGGDLPSAEQEQIFDEMQSLQMEFHAPLRSIFDEQLRPRLESLLTDAQRRASSQPADARP